MAPNPRVYFDVATYIDHKHLGRVVIELFADTTPRTAESFRVVCTGENVGQIQYKDTVFNRVEHTMCRGGSIALGRRDLESIYGVHPKAENFIRKHDAPGTVSMLRPDGPAFFISTEKAPKYDGKFVVVGKVVEGLDVIEEITNLGSNSGIPIKPVYITGSGELRDKTRESNISPSQKMSTKEFQQVASTSNNQLSNSLKEIMSVNTQLIAVDPIGVVVPESEEEMVETTEIFKRNLNILSDLKTEVCALENRHKELLSKSETKISSVKNRRLILEKILSLSVEELENIENAIKERKSECR